MLIIFQSHSNQRKEGISYCTGHMGNPSVKYVFNFSQSYLRCLLPHAKFSVRPREDGKAAEESQGSFMKKFSKTAYGTSVRGNLELKNVQSSAGSRKSSPVHPYGCSGEEQTEQQQCINILSQIFPCGLRREQMWTRLAVKRYQYDHEHSH